MALWNPPQELNGIPLSDRSRHLLFAPMWMLFPHWRQRVLSQPVAYLTSSIVGQLRPELRTLATGAHT